jgi:hypothetical protein
MAVEETGNPIPSELLCPITGDLMSDPVTMDDGVTYDRNSTNFLSHNQVSPAGVPVSPDSA